MSTRSLLMALTLLVAVDAVAGPRNRRAAREAVQEQVERVSQSLYRSPGSAIHVGDLEKPLIEARRRAKLETRVKSRQALSPLNP